MSGAEPSAGDISFVVDGKEYRLVPSLNACMLVAKGGLRPLLDRLRAYDFEAFVFVVEVGLGVNPVQAKQVPDLVYKAGMINLLDTLVRYLEVIANGGRPPAEEEEEPDPRTAPSESENSIAA